MPVTSDEIAKQVKRFLRILEESGNTTVPGFADEVLLFCYRVRDQYQIIQSKSSKIPKPMPGSLNELLYQLESKPDQTLRNDEWRRFLRLFFKGIATGDFILVKK